MAITPRVVATQGIEEGPLQTAVQGLLGVEVDTGLSASLLASPSLVASLSGSEAQGGGRKKRKKELNPLIRVQFGDPKPVIEVEPVTATEQPVITEQPEITLLPVKKKELRKLERAAKRETDALLKKAAKQVAEKKAQDEEEEMMVVMLLSLDE